jgi:hypothetical protein
LSPKISHLTYQSACALFTPSDSEQRLHHTYYRGCWHVVSRCFQQVPSLSSSLSIALYNPKAFIAHAASLCQAFAHCTRFLTAASRRSLGRVPVPVWPSTLSGRLLIVALVGRYPANKLISRRLIFQRITAFIRPTVEGLAICGISLPFGRLSPTGRKITYVLLTRLPLEYPCGPFRSTCMFKTRRQR